MSCVSSPLHCLQLSTVMHVSLPGRESYHTVNCQIMAEVFIWDQVAIWDRRLIPSTQKSGMKMSQTWPASRWIVWHPSASEVVATEEMIQLTNARSKLLIPAVTHGGAMALIIMRDTLSWRAHTPDGQSTLAIAVLSNGCACVCARVH